jgi:hypothetical protein
MRTIEVIQDKSASSINKISSTELSTIGLSKDNESKFRYRRKFKLCNSYSSTSLSPGVTGTSRCGMDRPDVKKQNTKCREKNRGSGDVVKDKQ